MSHRPLEAAILRLSAKVERANQILQNVSNEAAQAREQARMLKAKLKQIRKALKSSRKQAKTAGRRKKVARKALEKLVVVLLDKQNELKHLKK